MECTHDKNIKECTCTYGSCSRKGNCCACIAYHRKNRELPACVFSPEDEKTCDRSMEFFAKRTLGK